MRPRRFHAASVVNLRGQYFTAGAWHYYDVASAFDGRNRRVYKSFYDETTTKTATWFFYYDALDRLSEVRYTPDTSVSGTYSIFQFFWIDDLMTLYWQTDYPAVTTSKRYTLHDESGRIYEMWGWPASGNAQIGVWAINPNAWGMDRNITGPTLFQPMLLAGQYQDIEGAAYANDGTTVHRPGVELNQFRTYDPFTGAYLQTDPLGDQTLSTYVYAHSNPVGASDPSGLFTCEDPRGCSGNPWGQTDGPANHPDGGHCEGWCSFACKWGLPTSCDCKIECDEGGGCPEGTYPNNDDGTGCHISNGCYCMPLTPQDQPGGPVSGGKCTKWDKVGHCINREPKAGHWRNVLCTPEILNKQAKECAQCQSDCYNDPPVRKCLSEVCDGVVDGKDTELATPCRQCDVCYTNPSQCPHM